MSTLVAAIRAEYPDLTDRHGRVWTWYAGDLYTHDDTLTMPRTWVESPAIRLPSPRLVRNPNYGRLCDICRSEWPQPIDRVVTVGGVL